MLLTLSLFCYTVQLHAQAIGDNDFRISQMGTDGDDDIDATTSSVAYNPNLDQYLVVWRGDDGGNGEEEIYGQLYNAATGAAIGSNFRISDMGPDGNDAYDATDPVVVFNSTEDEYLVIWRGDDNSPGFTDDKYEIFGQLLSDAGVEIGTNDFAISDVSSSTTFYGAYDPDVVWNSTDNEYLVVWRADDTGAGSQYNEYEIYGQRLSSSAGHVGTNDFRISDMGGFGVSLSFYATVYDPSVAYNSVDNEYMVVWRGTESNVSNGESEIYGQRLSALGADLGSNDFVLSDMGPSGDISYQATEPAIAYSSRSNEYLVVWQGEDDTSPLVDGESEIFGQFLSNTGAEDGSDFRISTMGDDSESNASTRERFDATHPEIAWIDVAAKFIVVWEGDNDVEALNEGEDEIFGQMLNLDGTTYGGPIRFSEMGDDGNSNYDAAYPAIITNDDDECIVVWDSDNNTGSLVDNEKEIWGQRFTVSDANQAPTDIILDPPSIVDGTATSEKISDLLAVDMDMDDSFTYALVAGAGDTDNASFSISGTDLNANTTFDHATKDTYFIRIQVNDGTTTFEEAITITVDEPVLTSIGDNFRISTTGVDGNDDVDAANPAIAFNSTDNEFLVVWISEHALDNKQEVYIQRMNGPDGSLIGSASKISTQGSGNASIDAFEPAVAYNSDDNEYLVVWASDDTANGMVDGDNEIFGQLVEADGTLSGSNFRISDVGGIGNNNYVADDVAVVYNATSNEYLVVWDADDVDASGIVDNEKEIFGQRLTSAGVETGTNDFRISISGVDGNDDIDADDPSVVWNSTDNEYFVVWDSDHTADGQTEIFGQRLDNTGAKVGTNNIRIIPTASADTDADVARVSYNSTDNNYLVVFDVDAAVDSKQEIYTQLINDDGTLNGSANKISDRVTGNTSFDQTDAAITYIPISNEYIVVWQGDDNTNSLIDNEFEVFLQRLDNLNNEIGIDDERISEQGGTGNANLDVMHTAIAYNPISEKALIVWRGDGNTPVVDNEFEIYGQLWQSPEAVALPVELTYFDAKPVDNRYVQLNWQTASEYNNEYFTVERSKSNAAVWEEVGRVGSKGASNNIQTYRTQDLDPHSGISYYRLKQTDLDGQYTYSQIVAVRFDLRPTAPVQLFPNPTRELLTITGGQSVLEGIQFFDLLGNEVSNQIRYIGQGNDVLTVDLSNLPVGMYVVKTQEETYQVYKF